MTIALIAIAIPIAALGAILIIVASIMGKDAPA